MGIDNFSKILHIDLKDAFTSMSIEEKADYKFLSNFIMNRCGIRLNKLFVQADYLKIGKASDLSNSKERAIYRFFEILPGGLCWAILFFVVFFSWKRPV